MYNNNILLIYSSAQKRDVEFNPHYQVLSKNNIQYFSTNKHKVESRRRWKKNSNSNYGVKAALESLDNDIALVLQRQVYNNSYVS